MIQAIILALILILPLSSYADYKWKTVAVQAITTSGTQDITTTKLEGSIPKGAILWMANVSGSLGTVAQGALITTGFASPGVQLLTLGDGEDNLSATDGDTSLWDDKVVGLATYNQGFQCYATLDSFIANGIRVNWDTNNCTSPYWIIVAFIAGTDAYAKAGIFKRPASAPGSTNVTSVGFMPDGLFALKTRDNEVNGIWQKSMVYNFMFGDNQSTDVTRSSSVVWRHGQSTSNTGAIVYDGQFYECDIGCAAESQGTFGSYSSSGFTASFTVSPAADDIPYFAYRGDLQHALHYVQTPASADAGLQSYSLGWQPGFSVCMTGSINTLNTLDNTGNSGPFGFLVTDYTDTYSIGWAQEDGSPGGTADTFAFVDSGVYAINHLGTQLYDGTVGRTSTEMTITYTDNPAQSNYWTCVSIEEQPEGAGGSKMIIPGGIFP